MLNAYAWMVAMMFLGPLRVLVIGDYAETVLSRLMSSKRADQVWLWFIF